MNKQQEKLEKFAHLADEYCGLMNYNAEIAKELSSCLYEQNSIQLTDANAITKIVTSYPRSVALANAIKDYIIEIHKILTQLCAEIDALGLAQEPKDSRADAEPRPHVPGESEDMQS